MRRINLNFATDSYSILIEPGLVRQLGRIAMDVAPHRRAMLIVDANIVDSHGRAAQESLRFHGYAVTTHAITADETHKTLETARQLYEAMLAAKLERRSPVIALGGGVVGDLAGFAAATYMRGLPVVQVPSTLLAMVDASIGGKTGVNFPRPGGELVKNLIGAFWQPAAVVIDPETLRTLDPRDLRCGLAECVKHALIADPELLSFIADNIDAVSNLDMDVISELIERSVRIKAEIVVADEREAGRRALLNLGHTFAHAIEPITELDLKHGEAVSIGLVAATRCAAAMGRLEPGVDALVADLLGLLDLPIALPAPVPVSKLLEAMQFDKKAAHDRVRLILPSAIGQAEIVEHVPRNAVIEAWQAVGANVNEVAEFAAFPEAEPDLHVFDTSRDEDRLTPDA